MKAWRGMHAKFTGRYRCCEARATIHMKSVSLRGNVRASLKRDLEKRNRQKKMRRRMGGEGGEGGRIWVVSSGEESYNWTTRARTNYCLGNMSPPRAIGQRCHIPLSTITSRYKDARLLEKSIPPVLFDPICRDISIQFSIMI